MHWARRAVGPMELKSRAIGVMRCCFELFCETEWKRCFHRNKTFLYTAVYTTKDTNLSGWKWLWCTMDESSVCHLQYSTKRKSNVISWAVSLWYRSRLFPCQAPQLLQEKLLSVILLLVTPCHRSLPLLRLFLYPKPPRVFFLSLLLRPPVLPHSVTACLCRSLSSAFHIQL